MLNSEERAILWQPSCHTVRRKQFSRCVITADPDGEYMEDLYHKSSHSRGGGPCRFFKFPFDCAAATAAADSAAAAPATGQHDPAGTPAQCRGGSVAAVTGELVDKLDSKSAKQGDSVVVKTKEDLKFPGGADIPKGSKLVGHVTNVQAARDGKENSQITIQFDHAELKGGQTLAIESVIESVVSGGGRQRRGKCGSGIVRHSPQGAPSATATTTPGMNGSSSNTANNRDRTRFEHDISAWSARRNQPDYEPNSERWHAGARKHRSSERQCRHTHNGDPGGSARQRHQRPAFHKCFRHAAWRKARHSSRRWHADGGRGRSGSPGRGRRNEPLIQGHDERCTSSRPEVTLRPASYFGANEITQVSRLRNLARGSPHR